MKTIQKIVLLLAVAMTVLSCQKDNVKTVPLASVNVTNVVVGGTALTLNSSTQTVAANNYSQLTLKAGQSLISLYPSATPNSPYYNQTINTTNGDYYSLFLTGASASAIDAVLIKEKYTNYTDSLCGVRFINLSPGSNAISVNVTGQTNGSTVQSLAYKAYSDFVQLPAKKVNSSYAFQIRDTGTGNVIASYTLATPYFNNVTIVLRGLSTAPAVLLVKDFK